MYTPAHPFLQIIHSKGNHWIVASIILSSPTVQVFDLLYLSVDDITTRLLTNVFGINVFVEMGPCPQQDGIADCDVFAIATCTALAHGSQLEQFDQKQMKDHLLKCFENLALYSYFHANSYTILARRSLTHYNSLASLMH